MPWFITTLHVAIEADTIEAARDILNDIDFEAEQTGVLTETAHLAGSEARLTEVPAPFDPEKDGLWRANELARGETNV